MKIAQEITLNEMIDKKMFWQGGEAFTKRLLPDECEAIERYIEECYEIDYPLTLTEINDLFWFDNEYIITNVLETTEDEFWNREPSPF